MTELLSVVADAASVASIILSLLDRRKHRPEGPLPPRPQ